MDRLKDFLDWHCENPHNVNFKMIVGKEDREDTLKAMREVLELLDTGLTPEQIMELKERDTAKDPEKFDWHWYKCPTCGKYAGGLKGNFCHVCGQRLKWED